MDITKFDKTIDNLRKAIEEGHFRSFEKYFERNWDFVFSEHTFADGNFWFLVQQNQIVCGTTVKVYVGSRMGKEDPDFIKRKVFYELLQGLGYDFNKIFTEWRSRKIRKPIKLSINDVAEKFGIPLEDARFIKISYANTKTE